MGPLRKNKPSSLATNKASPNHGESPRTAPEGHAAPELARQDPGVELLHSFQQQQNSPLSMTMPAAASPPETTWYTAHAAPSPAMPQMPLNTMSMPFPALSASGPQMPQMPQMMNPYPHAIQTNGVFPDHHRTPSMHSSLNSANSNGTTYPQSSVGLDYSPHASTSTAGYANMTESNRSSRTSVASLPDMPPVGQSNAMWESTNIDLSLQEMLNQPQLPSSLNGSINGAAEDDAFWNSSLFDFSGLFPNQEWNANPDFLRSSSPSAQDATPAEKLSEIWPTRPSRRKLGCCTPGYINCEMPADVGVGTSRKM